MHYPSHARQPLLDYIDDGFPEYSYLEEGYKRREVPAQEMLQTYLLPHGCSDTLPKEHALKVAEYLGYDGSVAGMPYSVAASALLTALKAKDVPAREYLREAMSGQPRTLGPKPEEWWAGLDEAGREAFMEASLRPYPMDHDLAVELRRAGAVVVYVAWEDQDWQAVFPRQYLRFVVERRDEQRAKVAAAGGRHVS